MDGIHFAITSTVYIAYLRLLSLILRRVGFYHVFFQFVNTIPCIFLHRILNSMVGFSRVFQVLAACKKVNVHKF